MYVHRRELWSSLSSVVQDKPWILAGDFNVIKDPSLSSDGSHPPDVAMRHFKDCLKQIDVMEAPHHGCKFTWSPNWKFGMSLRKLDYEFCNEEWLKCFPSSSICFLPPGVSDHSQLVVQIQANIINGPRPFKYNSLWQEHEEYQACVEKPWINSDLGISGLDHLLQNMKRVKKELLEFNSRNFSDIHHRVRLSQESLEAVQLKIFGGQVDPDIVHLEKNLRSEHVKLARAEMELLRNKARLTWLHKGDFNSSFFHRSVLAYKRKHLMAALHSREGALLIVPDEIEEEIVSYYKSLFKSNGCLNTQQRERIRSVVGKKVQVSAWSMLNNQPTMDELYLYLSQMALGKCPGPDGLSVEFYKVHWERIKSDVYEAILHFFATGFMPTSINATIISLIPKIENPRDILDFRPISCCNILYKLITRILMNRMRNLMGDLVDASQSAFIPGRSMNDSVLMMQELVHNYHKDEGVPREAIKLDLKNAYDTVEWDVIWVVMDAMGFPERFIFLIKSCIMNARSSICLNGALKGWFGSSRGLRQGDPISSYLFILVLEVFNGLIKEASSGSDFPFHPTCSRLCITHLSFADDMVIFASANASSFRIIKEVLAEFSSISGLQLNHSKSIIYFGSTPVDTRKELCSSLNMVEGKLPVKYLGVPLSSRKLTKVDFSTLIDKICHKIDSWQTRFLSLGGRAQLIRSTLFGVQNFWCSIFPLPKFVIKEVEQKIRTFLWKVSSEGEYFAKVAWETLCRPTSDGGLGFKSMAEWNIVCLCKLLWDIASSKDSLWVKWVHSTRLKSHSVWAYKVKQLDPWHWKKLMKVRPLVAKSYKVLVRGGNSSFLYDNWSTLGQLSLKLSIQEKACLPHNHITLKEAVGLKLPGARRRSPLIVQCLKEIDELVFVEGNDVLIWGLESDGVFSQRSMWHSIRPRAVRVSWAKWVWSEHGVPRHGFTTWLLFLGKLPTKDRLLKWRMQVDPSCAFCDKAENHAHLFFECEFTSQVWRLVLQKFGLFRGTWDWSNEEPWCVSNLGGRSFRRRLLQIAFMSTIYHLWQERNQRVFCKEALPASVV